MREKKYGEIVGIVFIYIFVFLSIFYINRFIHGPAIFFDEDEYFNLARQIWQNHVFNSGQYQILYPLVISWTFVFDKIVTTYTLVKILNAILYSSIIIPLYLIAKKFLENKYLCLGFAFAVAMMPMKATTQIVWAEPLFYPLAVWVTLFFIEFSEENTTKSITKMMLGMLLLYLTKQAGIVLNLAVDFAIMYEFVFNGKRTDAKRKNYLLAIGCNLLPILLCLIINKLVQGSAMGYKSEINSYEIIFTNLYMFFETYVYQIVDVIFSGYFVLPIVFIASLFSINSIKEKHRAIYIMALFWTLGICCLSALHLAPNNIENGGILTGATYSRYTCVVIPILLILGLDQLCNYRWNRKKCCIIGLLCGLLGFFFSPIVHAVTSKGFVSSFMMSWLNTLINGKNVIIWGSISSATWLQKLIVVAGALIMGGIVLLRDKRADLRMMIILVFLSCYAGNETSRMLSYVMRGPEQTNLMFRYIADNDIEADDIYYDDVALRKACSIYSYFWLGENQYSETIEGAEYIITMQEQKAELFYKTEGNTIVYVYRMEDIEK